MKIVATNTTAACFEAGNTSTECYTVLAYAWVAYCVNLDDREAMNRFAAELERNLRGFLPSGACYGILQGCEEDIRQAAILLLIRRYLSGNEDLLTATKKVDFAEIANQIERSVNAAIGVSSFELQRSILKDLRKRKDFECLNAHPEPTSFHPALRKTLWELSYEAQIEMVFATLRLAIENKVFPRGADMMMTMIEQCLSQSQVAESYGVSRQAVHQSIAPIRQYLREEVKKREFPAQ